MAKGNPHEDGNERGKQDEKHEQEPAGDGGRGEHEPDEGEGDNFGFIPSWDDEEPPGSSRPLTQEEVDSYRREGEAFRRLAYLLSIIVSRMEHQFKTNGLPAADIFFCLLMRVYYHNLSARRLHYELVQARREGYIKRVPKPNTVLHHLRQPWLTSLLERVVGITAKPLIPAGLAKFGVDSTKFYTSVYRLGADGKVMTWGGRKLYKWIKAHFTAELNSFAVTAVRVTAWEVADVGLLPELLTETADLGFRIGSVAADRGYVSKDNHRFIHEELGAQAYITFKRNNRKSKNGTDPIWDANLERYREMRGQAGTPHSERTLVEIVNWMVKSRFGRAVRGITEEAQFNEALLKFICHNLIRMSWHKKTDFGEEL